MDLYGYIILVIIIVFFLLYIVVLCHRIKLYGEIKRLGLYLENRTLDSMLFAIVSNMKANVVQINKSEDFYEFISYYDLLLQELKLLFPYRYYKKLTGNNVKKEYNRIKSKEQIYFRNAINRYVNRLIKDCKNKGLEDKKKSRNDFELCMKSYYSRFDTETINLIKEKACEIISDEIFIKDNLFDDFDSLDGLSFEYWCADLLRKNGFINVEVTQSSGDQGVDILAQKNEIKYAIQCKCYSKDIGNTPVQEVYAGKAMYRCQVAAVMTNRYFTSGAKELAEMTGVLLWDREKIFEMQNNAVVGNNSNNVDREKSFNCSNQDSRANLFNQFYSWEPSINVGNKRNTSNRLKKSTEEISDDVLIRWAIKTVVNDGKASTDLLQRRLSIGYAKAARLMDELYNRGIIGPYQGSKPREVLMSKQQYLEMLNNGE